MTERRYSSDDLTEVAAGLRRILEVIAAGGLSADSGTVAGLEGAAAALDALAAACGPSGHATASGRAGKRRGRLAEP